MNTASITNVLDSVLEGTIIGSFTKLGYQARSQLFDWDPTSSDLDGSVAIVTGATSGIGKATAAGLLRLGADVYITSRSKERAEEAASELEAAKDARGRAFGMRLDTGDFSSVLDFVDETASLNRPINVLIHNAGALTNTYETDQRGRELTLSTHLIGPYLLTQEIRPQLALGARVLFMSSGGMYTQQLNVDEIEQNKDGYRGAIAYAKAKRAQVELVAHLGPQWAPELVMHAVHPGWVDTAGVDAGLPGFGKVMGPLLRSAEQGADTMVWLAAGGCDGETAGQFWLDRQPRRTTYLPGTGTDADERQRLVEWLDLMVLPAIIET